MLFLVGDAPDLAGISRNRLGLPRPLDDLIFERLREMLPTLARQAEFHIRLLPGHRHLHRSGRGVEDHDARAPFAARHFHAALVTLEIPVHRALHIGVRVTGRHVEHAFKLTGAGREWSETQGNGRDNNRPSSLHDPHSWLDERLQDKLQCSRV